MGIEDELEELADPGKAEALRRFFKTGKGEYGEGDVFLGIKVPDVRKLANKHLGMPLEEVQRLLGSGIHEHRLAGLLILVGKFKMGDEAEKKRIFGFYLKNARRANNWDLVDLSADKIAGEYLHNKDKAGLYGLARSENLWERRIAIVATFAFIRRGEFAPTLRIAEMLLGDRHDLIHKAVGWMLREVGEKGGLAEEERFLRRHRKEMPRTMLRYAIEKFDEKKRKAYMR